MQMRKILLVQGANLTYLGKREPEIYGSTTAEALNETLLQHSREKGYQLDIFYTNIEGEAINRIYEAADAGADESRGLYLRRVCPQGLHQRRWPSLRGDPHQ
jgi:3-dehydroquinate dehydratase